MNVAAASAGLHAALKPGLFVVGVPIGNLQDISFRALAALTRADIILCEDTRRTAQLLSLHGVESFMPRLHRYDAHSRDSERWINQLKLGKSICLVSDAGTPAISDPGALLVNHVSKLQQTVPITAIPGPSAMTALLSICGFAAEHTAFTFRGFFPRKEKEQDLELASLLNHAAFSPTTVYFESPLRIGKTLDRVATGLLLGQNRYTYSLVVAKELTKLHECVFRGNDPAQVAKLVKTNLEQTGEIGEWCFAVNVTPDAIATMESASAGDEAWVKTLHCLLRANVSVSESAKQISLAYPEVNKKQAYKLALSIKNIHT